VTRSLARQFLVWQLAVVGLLLAAVAGFAAVRSDAEFRDTQGRRMLSVAEDVAALDLVRANLSSSYFGPLATVVTSSRNVSGADDVLIVDLDGVVRASVDPGLVGTRFAAGGSTAAAGRAWVGDPDGRTVDAQVPVTTIASGSSGWWRRGSGRRRCWRGWPQRQDRR
jgi:sensor histidine kinase regulating citrate/malate metabolism